MLLAMETGAFEELEGLRVEVDQVLYMPHLEAPADQPHPFVYFLSIINDSEQEVEMKGRKWIVTGSDEMRLVVEGEGIVGLTPKIPPGDRFTYNSYHVIGIDSVAEGSFFGVTDEGVKIQVQIPRFELEIPKD